MKRLILAAGVAALAITSPVMAKPDKDRGGGKGQSAKVERGGGKSARAERRGPDRKRSVERRRGNDRRAAVRQERGRDRDRQQARGRDRDRDERRVQARGRDRDRDERRVQARGRDRDRDQRVVSRGRDRDDDRRFRGRDRDERVVIRDRDRDRDRDIVRVRDFNDGWWDDRFDDRNVALGFVGGCPPGLAKKTPACIPPGQAKNYIGQRVRVLDSAFAVPLGLRDIFRDTDDYYYRYDDGYMYRVDRDNDLIRALLPMFGLGMNIGQPFPYSYGYNSPSYMPAYYQPFYQSYGDDIYRYRNGYMYEIDGRTGLIEDIIPLYDQGYGVGQMLPASYSYYNVPYPYRSWYPETDDYYYRYAPGAIYQVDRETQLITAIASLLTGGNTALGVGQMLPMSYSAYNVPFAYRDRYYDTPDHWYRYSNGYIYQVDPQTRMITALIDAIV